MKAPPRLTNIKPRVAAADLTRAKLPPKTADTFYSTTEWKCLREACLRRDGFMCVGIGGKPCGSRASFADHIVRRRDGGKDDLANLRSLCAHCDAKAKERWDGSRKG